MNAQEINDIIDCMPRDRTVFHYFKDRYALALLSAYTDTPRTIRAVKKSPYAGLLNKSVVQRALESCADGMMTSDRLDTVWPLNPKAFVLTLGWWGAKKKSDYFQTSRKGYNLVLNMNFSNQHNGPYRDALDASKTSPFAYSNHPGNTRGRNTMAWARMDIDLDRGEALIEEIQNDWLREAKADYRRLRSHIEDKKKWKDIQQLWPFNFAAYEAIKHENVLLRYFEDCVLPYQEIWDEAMLSAAIWFLRKELGVNRIFYNTLETGCKMKGLDLDFAPPRSIYSTLPRKFCFQETEEHPVNVAHRVKHIRRKNRNTRLRWFQLNL